MVANLSNACQDWLPEHHEGNWQALMHNYDEVATRPAAMTLRPFEAVWWLQSNHNGIRTDLSVSRIIQPTDIFSVFLTA